MSKSTETLKQLIEAIDRLLETHTLEAKLDDFSEEDIDDQANAAQDADEDFWNTLHGARLVAETEK